MKRILTIQDLSCFGKCSLTIALPVLSAMGIEAVPLPTAVLSTHTAIPGFTYTSLAKEIAPVTSHWKRERIGFDMIAVGYLGQSAADEVLEAVRGYREAQDPDKEGEPAPFLFVDPVMGDHGKLYAGFDISYIEKMKTLCGMADLIVPNLTEGALMSGMEYRTDYDEAGIREMLVRLSKICGGSVLLTGVSLSAGMTGVCGYDAGAGSGDGSRGGMTEMAGGAGRTEDAYFVYQNEKVDASYHGTGDLFSAVLMGGMLRGFSLRRAATLAADFTADVIRHTKKAGNDPRHGVRFEELLPELMEKCGVL